MKIKGAWIHTPIRHNDERGHFEEQFKISQIESELGRTFTVKQVNQSVSNKGVIRGIHYTDSPEGQAKYVSCPKGAIWDVVVDLRKDSPTYGQWDAVELSAENGLSVFISEGLGHAFLSLEDDSVANYLCTSEYSPGADRTINALSAKLAIAFESSGITEFSLSEKDSKAADF
ncbi:dTDP-4-dehydrorhamnose 3,5-epimerase-like protein [Rhodoluna lacicola]|uniref:dTDP-4-dehydrorhamnose 3,5-epimerase-like protein n=2 Tax=Rhodoluna lacicola TaxID=529884 RepID=A0A060JJP8_9MICO|nr:dTDP-4-dehydrorhamnose 3,5-epimerase-like protein [Rhodoluna lacicola]